MAHRAQRRTTMATVPGAGQLMYEAVTRAAELPCQEAACAAQVGRTGTWCPRPAPTSRQFSGRTTVVEGADWAAI
jgi:hypothetical protein